VPEWANAVLSAAVAVTVSLVVTGIWSCAASRRRANAQRKLVRRRSSRVLHRDIGLIDEYFDNASHPEAHSRLRDLGAPEIDDLVVSTEELWPGLSEAMAEYRDALARFRRDPYMQFGTGLDPKGLAQPVVEAANSILVILGLPQVRLAPYEPPGPRPG